MSYHVPLVIALTLTLAPLLPAQQPPLRAGRAGGRAAALARGGAPEAILGMRARLELTEDQIARLGALRREALARRTAFLTQRMELLSELRAGDITRDEFAARIGKDRTGLRDGALADAEAVRSLLTDPQRERLQQLRRSAIGNRGAARRGMQGGRRPLWRREPWPGGPGPRAGTPNGRPWRDRVGPRPWPRDGT